MAPDVPTWLRGDPRRLRQVLVNLVGNAVKFTDHGNIEIGVTVCETTDPSPILRFEVADTGVGIPQAAHQRLFQPFTQLDGSMARRYGGTGLGSAISKRLVELMGGEIGVESEFGKGARSVHRNTQAPFRPSGRPPNRTESPEGDRGRACRFRTRGADFAGGGQPHQPTLGHPAA